ncbi:MAG: lysine--tRNA ligase [Chlamydiales bacterium]
MAEKPYYYQYEEFKNRLKKLESIRQVSIEPYPHCFSPSHTIEQILEEYFDQPIGDSEKAAKGETEEVCIGGRLILFRAMGKNAFAHIQGAHRTIQLMLNRELTTLQGLEDNELTGLKFIEKRIDLGDWVGVQGHLFRTGKRELTIFVKQFTLLCKTLLPLPEKHSGLADKEMRYRKRWLDLIAHEEVRSTFITRSRMIRIIRDFLDEARFLEVETPVLQNLYGGAEARPFCSYVHAMNQNVFLRTSLEIPLKKILVGGFERIYEIGKVFRNEGIDRTHNPEFTMLEAYAAYWDYNKMMNFVEKLIEQIAIKLFQTTKIPYHLNGEEVVIDVGLPWKRMTMKESIKNYANFDVNYLLDTDIHRLLQDQTDIEPTIIASSSRGGLIAMLFDEFVVSKLIQPHHITDHPIETTPLCKPHRKPEEKKEGIVERFESFFLGKEICNAYSELNDPLLQRELLEIQALKYEAGNQEAHPLDEEFLEAIYQGMPPAGGLGIGLDRLAMLFTDASSIRDVLYFPMMKISNTS